jgi:desulfoferrodoxin (superoxide reductase-like protein)
LTPAIKGLAAIILLLILSIPVLAHSPSQVLLAYDDMNQTLNVTITHTSTNPSHYVREVVMQKNGDDILRKEYANQTAANTFSYHYLINATAGDVLKATAYCSISGSRSAQIEVQGDF